MCIFSGTIYESRSIEKVEHNIRRAQIREQERSREFGLNRNTEQIYPIYPLPLSSSTQSLNSLSSSPSRRHQYHHHHHHQAKSMALNLMNFYFQSPEHPSFIVTSMNVNSQRISAIICLMKSINMLTGQSMSFISIPSLAPTPGRQSFTLSDFHSSLSKLLHCWGRLTRSLSVRHLVCDNISSNWTM